MKQKHVDASREGRLWLTQVIVPVLGLGLMVYSQVPQFRRSTDRFVSGGVRFVKNVFKK